MVRWSRERQSKIDYQKDLAKFHWFDRHIGEMYLDEIDRDMVDSIGVTKLSEPGVKPGTASRYLAVLHRRTGIDESLVFTYHGQPAARTTTKAWYNALQRAGIEDFRWHDLRHTWASWHVQRGTSLQELMELGGWSSYDRCCAMRTWQALTSARLQLDWMTQIRAGRPSVQ